MRTSIAIIIATCLIAIVAVGPATVAQSGACLGGAGPRSGIGPEPLAPNDGWASLPPGTTGGAGAAPERIYTVTNRQQLASALGGSSATYPKIIYVSGTIYANVDANNNPLTCSDYIVPPYSLDAYLAAYDPAVWGRRVPSGTQEDARRASQQAQQARVRLSVRSNTTIIGLGNDARIVGANLNLGSSATNVIIRNITFQDAFDCFPQWDPTDGSAGNWNSQYDLISLSGAKNVWIDHCAFNDGADPDYQQPIYFGRPYQWHDGAVDITNGADLVTVSWNLFTDHDKVMLIGSSDSATGDRGKLRVTVHHNLFANVIQRQPRVRFGKVHVYNNYYDVSSTSSYRYSNSWGVGVESAIYAENNAFRTTGSVSPAKLISRANGSMIRVLGTLINSPTNFVDVLAAYNAANDPDLSSDVGWDPSAFYSYSPDPTENVPALITCVLGDVDGDGWVTCADVAAVRASFGKRTGQPGFNPYADVNADGVIDVRDLAFVAQRLPSGTRCN